MSTNIELWGVVLMFSKKSLVFENKHQKSTLKINIKYLYLIYYKMIINDIIDIIFQYKISMCISEINDKIIKKRQQVLSGKSVKDHKNDCEWLLNNCTALRFNDKNTWIFFCNTCGEYFYDFSCENCTLSYIIKIICVSYMNIN